VRNFLSNPWLLTGVRLAIGLLFTYSGIAKLIDPAAFSEVVSSFQVLPAACVNLVALSLPATEILVGLAMLSGFLLGGATICALSMAALFAVVLGQALARGLSVDCGCFGSGQPSTAKTWFALGRDVALFAGCLLIYTASIKRDSRLSRKNTGNGER
jgi:putative oxidoreductase